jgi:hypothetical protein
MGFSRRTFLVGVAGALFLLGCAGPLSEGKTAFKEGRYADAKEALVRIESSSGSWDADKRAEYALYRGLTHGALGDRAAAGEWLGRAKELETAHPGTFSEDDRVRLKLALESIEPQTAAPPP